jgi:Hg(II)-responsive transcriptional regulator
MTTTTLTIGHLAKAANVGIETVRYYQTRGLLPTPPASGTYRRYPVKLVDRIRFIKRAQELGFSLEEIGDLLNLADGADRQLIRQIAHLRLAQIEAKQRDLNRMSSALTQLVDACAHTSKTAPCPIIAALTSTETISIS